MKLFNSSRKLRLSVKVYFVVLLWDFYNILRANATTLDDQMSKSFLEALGSVTLETLFHGIHLDNHSNNSCIDSSPKDTISIKTCLQSQCLTLSGVASLYNLSTHVQLDKADLARVAPAILYAFHQPRNCNALSVLDTGNHALPSTPAVWGYSFLFVTLINLCSLTGILVLPCMKSAFYKVFLMFMVALAVGTLAGSALLVLIPEALELVGGTEGHVSQTYIWKTTVVMSGIYLFFMTERIMRMINMWREDTKEKKRRGDLATRGTFTSSFHRKTPANASLKLKDPASLPPLHSPTSCSCTLSEIEVKTPDSVSLSSNHVMLITAEENTTANAEKVEEIEMQSQRTPLHARNSKQLNGHSHSHSHRNQHNEVAPVAYMIIFGDGLHNFIDGLSIGAAFTISILSGISVAVAVMCEELPHELGDFAILLNSGMRLRKAIMYNFLSACMCYFGLIVGIFLGANTSAHTWIFGLAGGMFLYISLVDMMPEMNSAAETEDGRRFGVKKVLLIQNFGLVIGYGIILFLALYGSFISFE